MLMLLSCWTCAQQLHDAMIVYYSLLLVSTLHHTATYHVATTHAAGNTLLSTQRKNIVHGIDRALTCSVQNKTPPKILILKTDKTDKKLIGSETVGQLRPPKLVVPIAVVQG